MIDTTVPNSPGWWLNRLFNMLGNPRRIRRLQVLHNYRNGNAPLPVGADNAREAYEAFQRKARSNFAELVTSATAERMTPVGFRTATDSDESGDAFVGDLWARAGLDVSSANVHDLMLSLSEAYVIVGAVDDEFGAPLITAEDPRWMIGDPDPGDPRKLRAALKLLHDSAQQQDRAYVYLPADPKVGRDKAEVWVAVRRSQLTTPIQQPIAGENLVDSALRGPSMVLGSPQGWDWDPDRSGNLPHPRMPVVRFLNKDGLGEYETHLDVIDRINHQILQRMVVATLQAFRQRAAIGLPLTDPETGQEIDYAGVFTADPGALWQLPETAKMWESQQVDLNPILAAVKDDVEHLAAVTRTPMHMMSPGGQRQSAEGASLSREGLVFKVRDRIGRCGHAWAQVMSLALLAVGETERADLAKLRTIWASPEHLSLAERGSAAAQLAPLLPRRTLYINILGMTPDDADRTLTELADEQVQQMLAYQALTAAQNAGKPPPVVTPGPLGFPTVPTGGSPPVHPGQPGRPGQEGQPGGAPKIPIGGSPPPGTNASGDSGGPSGGD